VFIVVDYWTLTNSDNFGLKMYLIGTDEERISKPVTSISWAGCKPSDNLLMQLQGMEMTVDLDFRMYDNGENKAINGSAVTVDAQRIWLRDKVFIDDGKMDTSWTLTGGAYSGLVVVVTDVMFHNKHDDPLSLDVSIRMTVGKQVLL